MIEPSEDLIPLAKVAKVLPPPLSHVHASTAVRWAMRGVGNPTVRLESVKIGGRRFTSRAAVERFVARLTGGEVARAAATAERRRQYRDAQRDLEAEGF